MDLYQPSEMPWRLVVGDGDGWDICDTFMNSAKEVGFPGLWRTGRLDLAEQFRDETDDE